LAALEYREGKTTAAANLYRSSCDAGLAQACTDLAYLVPETERKSMFEKGCNGGSMEGCSNLGFLLEVTQADESVRLYRKACDASYVKACNNLAFSYYKSGDLVASLKLYQSACTSGYAEACDAASRVAALMRSNPAVQGTLRDKAAPRP
jgi:TPR repeat protein